MKVQLEIKRIKLTLDTTTNVNPSSITLPCTMPKVDATMNPIFIRIWKIVGCLTNIYSNKTCNLGVLLKGDETYAK